MSALGIYQILFYFIVVLALTKPVGLFMARLFEGERTFLHPLLRPVERLFYRPTPARSSRSTSPSSWPFTRSCGCRECCP
jgi:K+-transporting ATPase ATPase A chain